MFNLNRQSIKINKEQLLAKLKENLVIYQQEFKEAQEDYLKVVEDFAERLYNGIKNNEPYTAYLTVQPPRDYSQKYQEAIDMLEYSVDDCIELDQATFKAYIKNEWDWTDSFRIYASSLKGG